MKTEWEKQVIATVRATMKEKAAAGAIGQSVWSPVPEPWAVQAVKATQKRCKEIREMSAADFKKLCK